MQLYSNPDRENEPTALPDVEIFFMSPGDILDAGKDTYWYDENGKPLEPGYYYWYCFPGCCPDSEPIGPFKTAQLAREDVLENNEEL